MSSPATNKAQTFFNSEIEFRNSSINIYHVPTKCQAECIQLAPYPKPRALDLLIKSSLCFVIECHLTQGHFLPEISAQKRSITEGLVRCCAGKSLFLVGSVLG